MLFYAFAFVTSHNVVKGIYEAVIKPSRNAIVPPETPGTLSARAMQKPLSAFIIILVSMP